LVAGSTSATSLRLVIIGSRVSEAITLSWLLNGRMPGPEIWRSIFTSGCSLIRVPVSWIPTTWASASTPPCSSAWDLAADFAPKLASAIAMSTSAAVMSRPTQNIHFNRPL
jgi:hypothetical protein